MPKKIGVREFKQRASEILREVREASVTYDVTYRGEVIASLIPARKEEKQLTIEEWDALMDSIAERSVDEAVPEYRGKSAVDMVRESRDRLDWFLDNTPPTPAVKRKSRKG